MKYLYRMTHINNICHILRYGITHPSSRNFNPNYVNIGDPGLIERRKKKVVETNKGKQYIIRDYIPFYFYARMPMLYNIQHGYGVEKVDAEDIVFMIVDIDKIVREYEHDYFFSDGHAYSHQTNFYDNEDFDRIDDLLDLGAIRSNDWGDDYFVKIRKQAEFLVKGDIEVDAIVYFICHSESSKEKLVNIGLDENKILVRQDAYFS